jgi:hypothetical protein
MATNGPTRDDQLLKEVLTTVTGQYSILRESDETRHGVTYKKVVQCLEISERTNA